MLVLPAIVFLSAVALRLAGGRGLLARTAWVVFEWTSHVSRLGAALLFVGLPGLVVILGGITLVHIWREDHAMRRDAREVFAILQRHFVIVLLAAATLLACVIVMGVVGHLITD